MTLQALHKCLCIIHTCNLGITVLNRFVTPQRELWLTLLNRTTASRVFFKVAATYSRYKTQGRHCAAWHCTAQWAWGELLQQLFCRGLLNYETMQWRASQLMTSLTFRGRAELSFLLAAFFWKEVAADGKTLQCKDIYKKKKPIFNFNYPH